jgi:hypothetical protein
MVHDAKLNTLNSIPKSSLNLINYTHYAYNAMVSNFSAREKNIVYNKDLRKRTDLKVYAHYKKKVYASELYTLAILYCTVYAVMISREFSHSMIPTRVLW